MQSSKANQDIKLIAWRREICPILMFSNCHTFLQFSLLDTLGIVNPFYKEMLQLIYHQTIETKVLLYWRGANQT